MQQKSTPIVPFNKTEYFKVLEGLESSEGTVRAIGDFDTKVCTFRNFLVFEKMVSESICKWVVVPWMTRSEARLYGMDLEGEGHFAFPITMTGKASAILSMRQTFQINDKNVILPYRHEDQSVFDHSNQHPLYELFMGEYRFKLRKFIGFQPGVNPEKELPCIKEQVAYKVARTYLACRKALRVPGVYLLSYDGITQRAIRFEPGKTVHAERHYGATTAHVVAIPFVSPEEVREIARAYVERMMKELSPVFYDNYPTNFVIVE